MAKKDLVMRRITMRMLLTLEWHMILTTHIIPRQILMTITTMTMRTQKNIMDWHRGKNRMNHPGWSHCH